VAEEKLDLFEVAVRDAAECRARAAQVVRRETGFPEPLSVRADHVPDRVLADAALQNSSALLGNREQRSRKLALVINLGCKCMKTVRWLNFVSSPSESRRHLRSPDRPEDATWKVNRLAASHHLKRVPCSVAPQYPIFSPSPPVVISLHRRIKS